MVWISLRYRGLHLGHCDHRQETDEQQKQRSENPERADVRPDVYPCWMKDPPRRRQKITHQTPGYNDEPFEPHAGVHAHAHEKHDQDVVTAPAEPKELRR